MTFEQIKQNFQRGLWNIQMVKVAADKGVITHAQFQEITGEEYTA